MPVSPEEAIDRIRTALARRSGKRWDVLGGRAGNKGQIYIRSPENRRLANGDLTEADRMELGQLLGYGKAAPPGGVIIGGGDDFYREYIDRVEGRSPSVLGKRYRAFRMFGKPSEDRGFLDALRIGVATTFPWLGLDPEGLVQNWIYSYLEYEPLLERIWAILEDRECDNEKERQDHREYLRMAGRPTHDENLAWIRNLGRSLLSRRVDLYRVAAAMEFETNGRSREILQELWRDFPWMP